ncbi:MAG: ATP-binding protein [Thermotogae bacterium]|nr:ATP-binding protein [Thermotogota bacterium]
MRTIADHLIDIAENSVNAGSKSVEIHLYEDETKFEFEILDDGRGMGDKQVSKIFDPFFTTKNKKTGLGLPLLKEYAELTGGSVEVISKENEGTKVKVLFKKTIDCQPIGDIAQAFATLVTSSDQVLWKIIRCNQDNCYDFSSEDVRDLDLTNPHNIKSIFEYFKRLEAAFR